MRPAAWASEGIYCAICERCTECERIMPTMLQTQLLMHLSGAVSRPFTEQGFHRHARLFMTLPLTAGSPRPD